MFKRGPERLEMCFYAYKNVLEPMGHLGANLIFSILTLNQVKEHGHKKLDELEVEIGTLLSLTASQRKRATNDVRPSGKWF